MKIAMTNTFRIKNSNKKGFRFVNYSITCIRICIKDFAYNEMFKDFISRLVTS